MTSQTKSSAPEKLTVEQRRASEEAALRSAELRAEADAAIERTHKAALLYEAAFLRETALHQPAQAVNDYLAAYNLDNRFRLPLHALIRLFERKRSLKNLSRLYDTQLRSAHTPEEKTTALIDQALLPVLGGSDPEAVRSRLERALEYDEGVEAALLLEWTRRSHADPGAAFEALVRRANGTDDPAQRAVLLLEVATELAARGEHGFALEALKKAALVAQPNSTTLSALAEFARAKGFVAELVEACEKRAELAAQEYAERPDLEAPLRERLTSQAAAHWYEAARLRCTSLSDPEGALHCVSRALEIRPDDLLLRQTRMLAFDLMEDREKAAEEARSLLAMGFDGEHAAALHFRLAEHALVAGNLTSARESLMEAIAHAGGSIAADAILDDLLLDEALHRERVERREARAATANPARASRFLLEAALIASSDLDDVEKARELFRRADAKADGAPDIAREAYGAGLDLADPELARFGLDKLLKGPLDADERAALIHHRIELADSGSQGRELLATHLENQEARGFFPLLSRLRAAQEGDPALLARAHEKLADQRMEPERAAAHLCAAARAHVRAGNFSAARGLLDRVLANEPSQRYALALQQIVLKELGAQSEIVALLRRAAEAQSSERDAELSLLLAGAAAEAAGDVERAAQNYEQAAARNPQSAGPTWALLRLGQRLSDPALVLRAREALSEREKARGQASIDALRLAEHYELTSNVEAGGSAREQSNAELAEACLDASLSDPVVGHHAALALVTAQGTSTELREQAVETLIERSTDELRPRLFGELGGMLLARGAEHARVLDVVERTTALAPRDPWALWTRASIPLPHDEEGHAEALEALAATTTDAALSASLRSEACFVRSLTAHGKGLTAALSGVLGEHETPPLPVAEMILETTSTVNDAPLRTRALSALREARPDRRTDLALARSLLAAGRAQAALDVVDGLLRADATDLAALELGRVCARQAAKWQRVAELCEALAARVPGEVSLQLLEEAAVVRMDELSDLEAAEPLLERILERAPARKLAFTRLHDLFSARSDSAKLITLLRARTELIDDAEELVGLFYELARLHRKLGDLEAALDAVDNVRMLDEHVGALALAAEIHKIREAWPEAVEVLEALAVAKHVPEAQRRLARLGAADFLEHRLKDGPRALAQLELLVADGQREAALFVRIADVAERIGEVPRAIEALRSAIELTSDVARSDLRLRCGRLLAEKAARNDEARVLLESVVDERPNHLVALQCLVAITQEPARRNELLNRFETEVRRELKAEPTEAEPLRKLLALADLRSDTGVRFVALSTLQTLQVEQQGEREYADRMARSYASAPGSLPLLTANEINALCAPEQEPSYAQLLRAVMASAEEIDQLEPSRFGASRGQRVSTRDAHPLRDELQHMANALGRKITELYLGGDDPGRVVVMPREQELWFLLGSGISAPLNPAQRAQAALQLAAAHLQTLPLLSRTQSQGARLIYAAMVASDCTLPPNILAGELGELPRSLGRALPRKTKKALPELVRALPDQGAAMEREVALATRHTRRLGLLLSGHLQAALEQVLGALPAHEAIAGSDDALDLISSWTSSTMNTLRNRLGFTR